MKYIFEKPFTIFWIVIPIVLVIGFMNAKKNIDVNIHDTYYVASIKTLALLISLYFGLIGLLYFLFNHQNLNLLTFLTKTHIIVSLLTFPVIYLLSFLYKNDVSYDIFTILNNEKFNNKVTYSIIFILVIFIISQLLFIANLILALFKK
jgi:heme/copper-type cytochrome/quinol oxidase subunit 1